MGYTCPPTYNPADFYVQTLAVIPGLEDTSRATVRAISDRFIVSSTAKQIDLLIQYEASLGQDMSNLELSARNQTELYILLRHCHILLIIIIVFVYEITRQQARWPVQFYWLFWRAFLDSYRNPAVHSLRIIQKIVRRLACFRLRKYEKIF